MGESGSPCRSPLLWLKNRVCVPFTRIAEDEDCRILSTDEVQPGGKPFSRSREIHTLDLQISETEVLKAIKDMPPDKASGSDGLPIEFYNCFWQIIRGDLMELIEDFHTNTRSIKALNKASITLIPKKEAPTAISDYRPISVINTVVKIITKILANRLQNHLPMLIAPNQTAFVKGRSMMESFLVAREFLNYCKKHKLPAILYKVDFEKAFDTVDWCFLMNLLIERGFPPKWITAVLEILQSASSAVRVNGSLTTPFQHKRGLRQGDPLSPMLFILVADSLNRFLSRAEHIMLQHARLSLKTIQFADDTGKKCLCADSHPLAPDTGAIQHIIEGWKSNFLSYGGRLTLIKAVLSAIPIHFMQATRLPKGVTNHIDRMRRSFLWRGNNPCKGIHCLVNWERVCTLKDNGGMGIIDLDQQNQALLLKWIWKISHEREGIWASTLRLLYNISDVSQLPQDSLSPFIKQISELLPFYNSSISWGQPDIGANWRWTTSGIFSCASAYRMMHDTGERSIYYNVLWKLKIPPKVRIFLWLMMDNKILTQEVLTIRGCQVQSGCKLCNSSDLETRDHIFWECPYATSIWRGLTAQQNIRRAAGTNPIDIWWNQRRTMEKEQRLRWDVTWAAGTWALRKERNRRTFTAQHKPEHVLINVAAIDVHNWFLFS
ncbi:uncharacterized protein LOC144553861 [Carex rostrata]